MQHQITTTEAEGVGGMRELSRSGLRLLGGGGNALAQALRGAVS